MTTPAASLRFRAAGPGLVLLVSLAAACADGSDTTPSDATGSSTTTDTTTSTTSSTTSSTTTGAGGAGGSGGAGGATQGGGGAGGDCPDVVCQVSCPEGYWPELDGCPLCACKPPANALIVEGVAQNPQFVTFKTTPSLFIGGIDRWVFDFAWGYDDPAASDDAETLDATLRIMKTDPMYEPTAANATWWLPDDAGMPLEALEGTYTLYGFGVITYAMTPATGWLSIRRVGDTFEGGVWLVLEPSSGQGPTVEGHGTFSVPVPN